MEPTAVVAGGGIAGLASALGLAQAGWHVTVLEQATELGEVGAGVALARNGVAALRGLGFDDSAIEGLGVPTRAGGVYDLHGRPIRPIADDVDAVAMRGVHRARLHSALLQRVRDLDIDLVTGITVTGARPGSPDGEQAVVRTTGAEHAADLVVAADGVRSAVRAALTPSARAAYSGYSSWRAVTPLALQPSVLRQYWGPHAEFGTMPVGPDQTYWYGYVKMPEGLRLLDEHAAARDRFTDWAPVIVDLIEQTDPGAVMRHDVLYLPGGMPRYVIGRMVATGDAAHGGLPTVGQGAATALEDGISVARLVGAPAAAGRPLAAALAAYDSQRRPRCRAISRTALVTARFGSHLGPRFQGLRNTLVRMAPTSAISRGADAVMGWNPPA
ncbi:FAD-dependent oxidoreductase [Occultella kanbiaonis]|uniref:FAD-dependent oxidoreductase n=1 Tax=Occultella kanbiaonis TaxID=2675754 RepID=UPI001E4B91CD|nr:FAD-dependent monooxygenase [Occultella kanbiaonis]